jgi:hypothetical protein
VTDGGDTTVNIDRFGVMQEPRLEYISPTLTR